MATVHVLLPGLLAQIVGGSRHLEVQAETVQGIIDRLLSDHPVLRVHLYDESGGLRPHVNLFFNHSDIRWLSSGDVRVRDGDTLTVMQAVSGG
jgi:molybdopterin converting factor small subunit